MSRETVASFRDRPLFRLTRHFFGSLFDLGFLSEVGAESFERLIIGVCALFLSLGLLLVRIFMTQYASLSSVPTPEPYRQAVLGGDAFVMALPMWIVAFVTVLISHALFPDERDFRILGVLPIRKPLIFGAKLLSLTVFGALFIIASHVALLPLAATISISRWAEHAIPIKLIAFNLASIAASVFAILLVTSVNGLLVLAASRGHLTSVATVLRSLMISALVLALPLVGRLPAIGPRFTADAVSIYFSPPAWFVALEWLLLGHFTPQFLGLAGLAVGSLALLAAVTFGTYAVLYRDFERVARRPAGGLAQESRLRWLPQVHGGRDPVRNARLQARVAVQRFIAVTLRRSPLHQGVLVFVASLGGGMVLNNLIGGDIRDPSTITWAPFVLMLFTSVAVKAALTLPTEQRANWMFRMTEESSVRVQALRAAMNTVIALGVVLPVVMFAPLHLTVFGRGAFVTLAITTLSGVLFVEFLMKDWDRIPFTCSYIPGKRFLPKTFLMGIAIFLLFTGVGAGLVRLSLARSTPALIWATLLVLMVASLRHARLARWRDHPLLFDDVLPSEINPLRLSAD